MLHARHLHGWFVLVGLVVAACCGAPSWCEAAKREPAAIPPGLTSPTVDVQPPADLRDPDAWIQYQRQAHVAALPLEARVFYRRALEAHAQGSAADAMGLARAAGQLDPSFLAARWALIRWSLVHDPAQALVESQTLVDTVRRDFPTQWSLVMNAAYLLASAWALALLLAATLLVIVHNAELRHALMERLHLLASPFTSRAWAWILLAAPFALGLGIVLPVTAMLGLLWPSLKRRERMVLLLFALTFAAMAYVTTPFERFALPMRSADRALAPILGLETEPATPAARDALEALATRFPHDPQVTFARGWVAYRLGDWPAAEAAWREVTRLQPDDDRAQDDLGAALAQQGRFEEAVRCYQGALRSNPRNATAYFNLSQAYTRAYDFEAAGLALDHASALDFDRVSEYKNQPARNGSLAPVAEWIAPATLWHEVEAAPPGDGGGVPPWWRGRLESEPRAAGILVLTLALAIGIGMVLHRRLPIHRCANCERVVCRRCSERRRAQALCTSCARVAASASSPEFARVLLVREKARASLLLRIWRGVLTVAAPGAGLMLQRRVWRALLLLFAMALLLVCSRPSPWPYAARARFGASATPGLPAVVTIAALVLILSWSGAAAERRAARQRVRAGLLQRNARRPETVRVSEADTDREAA